jgi:hypothetical protein
MEKQERWLHLFSVDKEDDFFFGSSRLNELFYNLDHHPREKKCQGVSSKIYSLLLRRGKFFHKSCINSAVVAVSHEHRKKKPLMCGKKIKGRTVQPVPFKERKALRKRRVHTVRLGLLTCYHCLDLTCKPDTHWEFVRV